MALLSKGRRFNPHSHLFTLDHRSFLTVLCLYLGMVLVKILPSDPDPDNLNHSAFFTVAVLEVLGNSTLTVGLFLIGSGVLLIHSLKMYQVIYSSVIVFTAILSSILLRKQLSRLQWVAVIVITLGLSISALSSSTSKASNPILGFFVCLAGTLFLAGVYTLNEHHLSTANRNYATPTPHQQSFYVGLYSTILILIVILFVSIPSISELPLLRSSVISGYLSLILASFGHSLAYFELVKSTGAVATGVLQALRAIGVFFLSHIMYCRRDSNQCFTAYKGYATLVVVVGVIGFGYAKMKKSSHKPGDDSSMIATFHEIDETFELDVKSPRKSSMST